MRDPSALARDLGVLRAHTRGPMPIPGPLGVVATLLGAFYPLGDRAPRLWRLTASHGTMEAWLRAADPASSVWIDPARWQGHDPPGEHPADRVMRLERELVLARAALARWEEAHPS